MKSIPAEWRIQCFRGAKCQKENLRLRFFLGLSNLELKANASLRQSGQRGHWQQVPVQFRPDPRVFVGRRHWRLNVHLNELGVIDEQDDHGGGISRDLVPTHSVVGDSIPWDMKRWHAVG